MMLAPRIDVASAREKLEAGEAVAVDVTSALVYPAISRRIAGSIRIPPEPIIRGLQVLRPAAEIMPHFAALPEGREIIAYCT